MTKYKEITVSFSDALKRLGEALVLEKNDIVRDSAIQRFEFNFELAWKTIKAYLEEQGVSCTSPRECFREAYHQGLIEYENIWLEMIEMRNEIVHTYNIKTAEKIYARLNEAFSAMKLLLERLEKTQK